MAKKTKTKSVWMQRQPLPAYTPLTGNLRTEVCIIGAGIAGLSVGYQLALEGKQVVILDQGLVGGGETVRTTAHLTNVMDDRFYILERAHGEEGSRLAAESHGAAIDRIEEIVQRERIRCDFQRLNGYLFLPPGESTDVLDREKEAAQRAGLNPQRLPRVPVSTFNSGPCLSFERQGQFHPVKYLKGLVRAIEERGGRFFGETQVTGAEAGTPAKVMTADGSEITADFVVCATNTPVIDCVAIHTKQAAYRTFAIGARVAAESVERALYWDTATPYHYIRLTGEDLLIVGGEDHKTGQEDDGEERFASLESWTRQRFEIGLVEYRWSGQVIEPVDGMAFIGRNPGDSENIFIVTGDSGQGMTHGTIAGVLIPDLIMGRANPWKEFYDPSRKPLRSLGDFISENVNAVKHFVEYVTPGEVGSENEIPPDEGAIVRSGLTKYAVYREPNGAVRRLSAACPHLGCIVHWNSLEKSWDCPCHGSRFDARGEVVNGPALKGLNEVTERAA